MYPSDWTSQGLSRSRILDRGTQQKIRRGGYALKVLLRYEGNMPMHTSLGFVGNMPIQTLLKPGVKSNQIPMDGESWKPLNSDVIYVP